MNLGLFTTKKQLAIIVFILCIVLSIIFSYTPHIVNLQNKIYFNNIISERKRFMLNSKTADEGGVGGTLIGSYLPIFNKKIEGMTDLSANNIIYSIINDLSGNNADTVTPYQQLQAVRSVALMGDYSNTNLKTITEILDNSGNSDNTKLSNINRYLLTYTSLGSSKK